MSSIACPYCFKRFSRGEVLFRCSNKRAHSPELDEELTAHWKSPHMELPAVKQSSMLARLFDRVPKSAKCSCGAEAFNVMCPHCHNLLPRELVDSRSMVISIVGARSSGKTNYITVLLKEFMDNCDYLGQLGISRSPFGDREENRTEYRYEHDFYDFIYRQGRVQGQTQINDPRSRVPLIYRVSQKGKDPIYLVFYDTAGENFMDQNLLEENVEYLSISDATIFLLDTFNVPFVNTLLRDSEKLTEPRTPMQFYEIFNKVREYYKSRTDDAHFKKPMAFVFTKIDAILRNRELFAEKSPANMSLEQNSAFLGGGGVDLDDLESVHDGMKSVLGADAWRCSNFLNQAAEYSNHHFFGISALGSTPVKNEIRNLRPYRVLDPLVWCMHQLKYSFPLKKKS